MNCGFIVVFFQSYTRWLNFALQEQMINDMATDFANGMLFSAMVSKFTSSVPSGLQYANSDDANKTNISISLRVLKEDSVRTNVQSNGMILNSKKDLKWLAMR